MAAEEKKLTHPLPDTGHAEMFYKINDLFTSSPPAPLCSVKETGTQTLTIWSLGDPSPPSSQPAGFPNKVAILCRNTSSPDLLACCAARRASLDLVTSLPRRGPRRAWLKSDQRESLPVLTWFSLNNYIYWAKQWLFYFYYFIQKIYI